MPTKKKTKAPTTPAEVMAMVNKKWGPGTMRFADDPIFEISRIPTGILSLDYRMKGGFARGRHTEIYGPFSVGKNYVVFSCIAAAQELGLNCAFIECEGSFDPVFARHIGVQTKKLAMHEQEHGNKVVDFIETLLRSGVFDVIVMDSIAALLPKSEWESEMSSATMGTQQAKLMSQALRKLTAANHRTALLYLNQTREPVGSMFAKAITSGGKAMGFYAGTRLELVRTETIKRKRRSVNAKTGKASKIDVPSGHRVLVKVSKDKTGIRPFSETTFVFDYDKKRHDPIEDLIYLGRVLGFVQIKGNTWTMDEYDVSTNGRPKFKKFLRKNRKAREDLELWIRASIDDIEEPEDEDDDDE